MEIVLGLILFFGVLLMLKHFGKGIIYAVAILLTPFYAVFKLFTGQAENKTNTIIIAVCGLLLLAISFLVAFAG